MNASIGKTTLALASALMVSLLLLSEVVSADELSGLERVKLELVAPPFVPEHEQAAGRAPVVVEVRLEVEEKEIEVSPGVFVQAMTFMGAFPAP